MSTRNITSLVTPFALFAALGCSDRFGATDCRANRTCSEEGGSSGSSGKSNGGSSSSEAGMDGGGVSNTGGTSGMGGSSNGGGGDAGGSGACKGDVADDAACWTSNEYGVFVSSDHGVDATGDGTKEAPYATITKGIAAAGGKKVYVCLGTKPDYVEKISLTKDLGDGVQIYGGFDCETWEYSTTRKASVKSPENIALRIQDVKQGVYIENLRFTAADGKGEGLAASSYGAFVTGSKGVLLRRVEITAGNGADGAAGSAGREQDPALDAAPRKVELRRCALEALRTSAGAPGVIVCVADRRAEAEAWQANPTAGVASTDFPPHTSY